MEGATLRIVFLVRRIAAQQRMRSAFREIDLRNVEIGAWYRDPSGYPALRLAAPLRRCGQDTSPPRGRSHAAPPTGHPSPLPREHRNPHAARNLLRARSDNLARRRTDQIRHHQDQMLATPRQSRIKSNQDAPVPLFNDAPNCLRISDVGKL